MVALWYSIEKHFWPLDVGGSIQIVQTAYALKNKIK